MKNTSLGYDTDVIYKQTILNTFSSDVHRTQSSSSSRAAPSSKSKSGPKDVPSSQDMFADSEDGSDSEPIVSQVRVQKLESYHNLVENYFCDFGNGRADIC